MTPEFGLERDKRREKMQECCNHDKKALTQHEHIPGHWDRNARWTSTDDVLLASLLPAWNSFSCKWLLASQFFGSVPYHGWHYLIRQMLQNFQKEVWKKSVSEIIWHQSDLKWHQCMVITKSYQEGYLRGDWQHVMLNFWMRFFTKGVVIPSFEWGGQSRSNALCSHFMIRSS